MKLLYYPNEFLDKKVKDVDINNPGFDPVKVKEDMEIDMLARYVARLADFNKE